MGRSVSVPSQAVATVFVDVSWIEGNWGWEDFIDDLRAVIRRKYPSMTNADRWADREERAILANYHADVVVAEYCGLASVSLVLNSHSHGYSDASHALANAWCYQVADGFRDLSDKTFNGLQKVATACNGEVMYRRVASDRTA